jgi:hypothetical protein
MQAAAQFVTLTNVSQGARGSGQTNGANSRPPFPVQARSRAGHVTNIRQKDDRRQAPIRAGVTARIIKLAPPDGEAPRRSTKLVLETAPNRQARVSQLQLFH